MSTKTQGLFLLLVLMPLVPSEAQAQQPDLGCLPPDDRAEQLLAYATRLAHDTGSAYDDARQRYQISLSPDAIVELVSDDQTCRKAARSFAHATGDKGRIERNVYAVVIHGDRTTERFIVLDPAETLGEYQAHIVFDRNFKVLARFAG